MLAVAARLGFAVVGSNDGSARLLLAGLGTGLAAGIAAEMADRPEPAAGWFVALALIVLARPAPLDGTPDAV